jgi:hypothetical protein
VKRIIWIVVAAVIVAGLLVPVFATGKFDNIVTTVDVEKATGLTGIKQVPREQKNKFRNGDINFVASDGAPLLMIEFRPDFVLDEMKADSGYFKAPIKGLGVEAFSSPAFDPQFSINLHKGRYVTVVTTHVDPKDKTRTVLKMDQLMAIAKIVADRM